MLQCLSSYQSSTSATASPPPPTFHSDPPPSSSGASTEGTPASSVQPSPALNLTHEYSLAVQTTSFNEIWSKFQVFHPNGNHTEDGQVEHYYDGHMRLELGQMLHPDRTCVEEALGQAKPNKLTRLVSSYFDQTETASQFWLQLHQSLNLARAMYSPLHHLLSHLPSDSNSLTQSQCDSAFDVFLQFHRHDNPFPSNSDHITQMRLSFSQLETQLSHRLRKSRSNLRLLRRLRIGFCLCSSIATAVGMVMSTAANEKRELSRVAQLDAAARCTYVLNRDLDTIGCLVARLHTEVEGDKLLIGLGLDRGRDKHPIYEVLKQLHKNHEKFLDQLHGLEEHICICFNRVNKDRSLLLREISLHQNV